MFMIAIQQPMGQLYAIKSPPIHGAKSLDLDHDALLPQQFDSAASPKQYNADNTLAVEFQCWIIVIYRVGLSVQL
jgi:hypothetical protein